MNFFCHSQSVQKVNSSPFPSHSHCGTHNCYSAGVTGESELHKRGKRLLLPTILWHPPPHLCTNSKTVFLVLGYLSLNSKELHSLWAKGSQIHFLPRWPSGSLALPMPSSFGKASSFSVSQSSPIVASFNCREKGKYLTQACRIVQVPGRKAFRVKPKLPLRDSKMQLFYLFKNS